MKFTNECDIIIHYYKRGNNLDFDKKEYIPPFAEMFYYHTEDILNGSQPVSGENNSARYDEFKDFDPSEWESMF